MVKLKYLLNCRVKRLKLFTLQLSHQASNYIQSLVSYVDVDYLHIRLIVVSTKNKLFSAEIKLLEDISYRV